MANDIITTLHPDNDPDVNLYPNIKKENIPTNAIDKEKLEDDTVDYSKLDSDVKNLLNSINQLKPSGVDTSINILAFTTNKGIYVGSDTGHWYYWNGTQYADGGEFVAGGSVPETRKIAGISLDSDIDSDTLVSAIIPNIFDKAGTLFDIKSLLIRGTPALPTNTSVFSIGSNYIENLKSAECSNDYVFRILAYDQNNTFKGYWNGIEFGLVDAYAIETNSISIESFDNNTYNYKFRIEGHSVGYVEVNLDNLKNSFICYCLNTNLNDLYKTEAEVNVLKQNTVFVDDYYQLKIERNEGFLSNPDDWSRAINKAVDDAGEGGKIVFSSNKVYQINGSIKLKKNQTVLGNNAKILRKFPKLFNINGTVTSDSTSIPLSTTLTNDELLIYYFEIGDKIYLQNSGGLSGCTNPRTIVGISNKTIYLDAAIGESVSGGITSFNGWYLVKTFNMMESSQLEPSSITIKDLIFDGNNSVTGGFANGNLYWYLNNCLHVYGYGSIVDNCKFINMPNECIITGGSIITNCYANNLFGSFVHLSVPKASNITGDQYINTIISNNIVTNSNIIHSEYTGHSDAVIEQSWNGGNVTISNNRFIGNNECVCFDLSTNNGNDGTQVYGNVIINGNYFKNYKKVSKDILEWADNWDIGPKIMNNNIFVHCGTTNLKLSTHVEVIFENNILSDGTVVNIT